MESQQDDRTFPSTNAACHPARNGGVPLTYLFFSEDAADVERAKEICGVCEMKSACLEVGLSTKAHTSVWGGVYINSRGRIAKGPRKPGRPKKSSG